MRNFMADYWPFVILILVIPLLLAAMIASEDHAMADFSARCLASGETQEKCAILAEVKSSADNAGMAAGFAVGFSAARGVSR